LTLRSVLDTNIWVASVRWQGRPYHIRKAAEHKVFTSITSLAILAEITRVLHEYFDLYDEGAYEWHCHIGENSELVNPIHPLNAIPDDPDDNKFVECAVKGNAQFIVSRDDDLLRLERYNSVQVVDDTDLLDILLSLGEQE
jgi:uncharacterized protein